MNATTVDTTAMDPIVFANTFNAAQKLAETHLFSLRFNSLLRDYELVSTVSGNVFATFGNVLLALTWMREAWGENGEQHWV